VSTSIYLITIHILPSTFDHHEAKEQFLRHYHNHGGAFICRSRFVFVPILFLFHGILVSSSSSFDAAILLARSIFFFFVVLDDLCVDHFDQTGDCVD
jgi:drug/metabolite transporter superfamily protein YnfA